MAYQASSNGHPRAFFGRDHELTELRQMLDSNKRLITVLAPGGYGKSSLVAKLCAVVSGSFVDGTHEIHLAPVGDHSRIARVTAEALGLSLHDETDPVEQLSDYLREKRMLLHFDNFEHLLPGAQLIDTLLKESAGIQVVVTSRELLQLSNEQVFNLHPLPTAGVDTAPTLQQSPSAAAQLFADRAVAVAPDFMLSSENTADVEAICQALEGVPLAIELVAAWTGTYSLGELKQELRHQLDITAKSKDLPERHWSVRASCDWSYKLLTAGEQLVLRCISTFKGGFFTEYAREVLPVSRLDTILKNLDDKCWLYVEERMGRPRYYLHDAAIHEYAFQQLLASDDYEIAVLAHCQLFAELVEQERAKLRTTQQLETVRSLGLELENIYEALDTALRRENPKLVVSFARSLWEYLLMVGGAIDCCKHYAAIREYCMQRSEQAPLMHTDLGLARANLVLGRYKAARTHGQAAAEAALAQDDKHCHALAEGTLGEVCKLEGHHFDARRYLNRCLLVMRSIGSNAGVAAALRGLGQVEVTEGNYDVAWNLFSESLERSRQSGDSYGAAACLGDLGNIAYRQGNLNKAHSLHDESLVMRRQLGDRRGIAKSLHQLGNVEFSRCDYSSAWALYSESLAIRRDIGERFGIAASLNNLGNVEYCKGNYADARQLHLDGLAIKREIGDRIGVSYSLNNLANIAIRMEQYEVATQAFTEALPIAIELKSKECTLAPLALCANLFARLERNETAAILYHGVPVHLAEAGLALDPMDGGMLEEAARMLGDAIPAEEQLRLKKAAEKLSLDELSQLTMKELASMTQRGEGQV
jgi:predicted ATPase